MSHPFSLRSFLRLSSLAALTLAMTMMHGQTAPRATALDKSIASVPAGERDAVISTEELVRLLKLPVDRQPMILSVGPRLLFAQAHIPGAEYVAAGSTPASDELLRKRAAAAHGRLIVLYCGCCPWGHCPNIHPAYEKLRSMGVSKVKMLYISDNFGADWVDKGYPTAKGE